MQQRHSYYIHQSSISFHGFPFNGYLSLLGPLEAQITQTLLLIGLLSSTCAHSAVYRALITSILIKLLHEIYYRGAIDGTKLSKVTFKS